MKRAAYYARVSSDLQRKEKTIDSQILELKKQIEKDGMTLVKEYIDDGYSGAELSRPAMNLLREDIKKNYFDTIYFLNTDRIARDVTYQTIIVAEILKNGKQIIINGKDYVHNPENKFTLTVLGAVSELERAKLMERIGRGKALRLAQGHLLGLGVNTFGYDYHRKTPDTHAYFSINEKEAAVVRDIFKRYAKGNVGIRPIIKSLEDRGIRTKLGGRYWRVNSVNDILKNHSYIGIKYFNRMKLTREYTNPIYGTKRSKIKWVKRDKSEWIGIKVPPIVSKEVFQQVQNVIAWNKKMYRNPRHPQLLGNLIRCGICADSFFSYRRHYKKVMADGAEKVYKRSGYKCAWRHRMNMHSKNTVLHKERCTNAEIMVEVLDEKIWESVRETLLDPDRLKGCMESLRGKKAHTQIKFQRRLKSIDKKVAVAHTKKQRLIELYASGEFEKEEYVKKSKEYDGEINSYNAERLEIASQIPVIYKPELVDTSVRQYCEIAKMRFQKCKDFETKRKFLLDYVRIVYANEDFSIIGSVPLEDGPQKVEFKIQGKITKEDRRKKYTPYGTGGTQTRLREYNLTLEDLSDDSRAMMKKREREIYLSNLPVKGIGKG